MVLSCSQLKPIIILKNNNKKDKVKTGDGMTSFDCLNKSQKHPKGI